MIVRGFGVYRQKSDNPQTLLAGEGHLLDMISAGAPLPQVLDKVCTALDLQVGNVVSLVLFPDDEEHTLHSIAESAVEFGLSAFSCTAILSPSAEFYGTLEMYCCLSRRPTPGENKLIERAAHLAALAIQNHNRRLDTECFSLEEDGVTVKGPRQGPPSSN